MLGLADRTDSATALLAMEMTALAAMGIHDDVLLCRSRPGADHACRTASSVRLWSPRNQVCDNVGDIGIGARAFIGGSSSCGNLIDRMDHRLRAEISLAVADAVNRSPIEAPGSRLGTRRC